MTLFSNSFKRRTRVAGKSMVLVAAAASLSAAAHATDYSEGPVLFDTSVAYAPYGARPYEANDLSSVGSSPTNIGTLTLGSNFITGATIPYGPIANTMTGERTYQDADYATFTVPTGEVLSGLVLVAPTAIIPYGTIISPGDRFFMGIASGATVNVTPPSSAGLLGYTLVTSDMIGSDVLGALGASSPAGFTGPPFSGATTFSGSLGAGTYSLWLLDGDNPVAYRLNLVTSQAPEPTSWAMFIGGFGVVGAAARRRRVSVKFS